MIVPGVAVAGGRDVNVSRVIGSRGIYILFQAVRTFLPILRHELELAERRAHLGLGCLISTVSLGSRCLLLSDSWLGL